jgi:hypothetical protein
MELEIDMLKLQLKAYKDKCDRLLAEFESIDKKADEAETHEPNVLIDSLIGPVIPKPEYDKMRLHFAKSRAALTAQLEFFKKRSND